jgi:serine/threonine-protein kinase RsbT
MSASPKIETIEILSEFDIVTARMRVRDAARAIGFGIVDQARMSVAISSLAHILELSSTHPGCITVEQANHGFLPGLRVVCTTADREIVDLSPAVIQDLEWLVDDWTIERLPSNGIQAIVIKWLTTSEDAKKRISATA